jgi:diacylglycerol kinase family enzyme
VPKVEIIVNTGGGGFVEGETEQAIMEACADAGLDAKVTLAKGGDEIFSAAERSTAEIIGAAGGDGTVNAVASKALERDKTLAVLPLGTLNHFSKDLGMPQELAGVVKSIAEGHVERVDVGEVNGRIFLNNSSIGLYPRIVHKREQQQERLSRGKWSAAIFAALTVFRRDPFFRVSFDVYGQRSTHKVPFVFVGNNEYSIDQYNIGRRESLQGGELSVYFLRRGGRWGVIRLLLRTLLGMLDTMKEFQTLTTDAITIDVRKSAVLVAFDGEVEAMQTPLEYRIRPLALKVIVPTQPTP